MAVSDAQVNEAKRALEEAASQINTELELLNTQMESLLDDAANQLSSSAQDLTDSTRIVKAIESLKSNVPKTNYTGSRITAVKDRKFKPDMVQNQRIR